MIAKQINNLSKIMRAGVTLVELLLVIAVMAIVTASAIPLVRTLTADREIREASRMLTTFIESARNDAMGRGFGGVFIERSLNDPNKCIDIYKIKRPPSYRGDVTNAQTVIVRNNNFAETAVFSKGENTLMAAPGKINLGDEIRFGLKGQWYEVYQRNEYQNPGAAPGNFAVVPAAMYPVIAYRFRTYKFRETSQLLTGTSGTIGNPPYSHIHGTIASYEVRRQPLKISSSFITLPKGTFIDLVNSGFSVLDQTATAADNGYLGGGNEFATGTVPAVPATSVKVGGIGIIFNAEGSLDYIYHQIYATGSSPPNPIFHKTVPYASVNLLVAFDREQDASNPPEPLNDLSNFWINITRSKGKITSAELADPSAGALGTAARRFESRKFARSGQSATGG